MNHSENGIGSGTLQVIADYQLERWLKTLSDEDNHRSAENPDWKQHTQYAAYHTINTWYTLPLASRTYLTLTNIFEKRWAHTIGKFNSEAFHTEMKHRVLAQLYQILLNEKRIEWPILLFEGMDVWVDELDMGLSMIVQMMESTEERSFVLHKYVLEDSAAVLALFTHLAIVFCDKAFGMRPAQLVVTNLLNGAQHRIATKDLSLDASLDYLKLVKDVYLESRTCTCCAKEGLHGHKFDVAIHQ